MLGANLGTTMTGWLVTVLGFKLSLGEAGLPLAGLGGLLAIALPEGQRSLGSKSLEGGVFIDQPAVLASTSVPAQRSNFPFRGAALPPASHFRQARHKVAGCRGAPAPQCATWR